MKPLTLADLRDHLNVRDAEVPGDTPLVVATPTGYVPVVAFEADYAVPDEPAGVYRAVAVPTERSRLVKVIEGRPVT